MPNATCGQLIRSVVARGLRLNATGAVLAGASSKYTVSAPLLVQYEPVTPDRARFSQTDGNGVQCALFIGPPLAVESCNLTMNLCQLDAEWMEFLCGGTVVTDGSYGTSGYRSTTDATVNTNGVAFESWSIAWNGRVRLLKNTLPAYYRHVFPRTRWQQGQTRMENGISVIPVAGIGEVNNAFGTGLVADPLLAAIGDSAYGWDLATTVPAAACGYAAVP